MSERWVCSVCGHVERGAAPPTTCPNCGAPFTAFVRQVRNPLARFRKIEIAEARPPGHRYVIVGNSAAHVASRYPQPRYMRALRHQLVPGVSWLLMCM